MLTKNELNSMLIDELISCQSESCYFDILLNEKFSCIISDRGPKTENGYLMVRVWNDRNYILNA